jgi:uncharacterized protein
MDENPSCLYLGTVVHRRLKPRRHRLAYRVFCLLADIDTLAGTARRLRLLSHNAFNVFSFYDRDYGPRDGTGLRPWVEGHLAQAGIALDGGSIRILCYPRLFGYVFNPLSVYYCYRRDGVLAAILYEVHNTFGEAHTYLIPVTGPADQPVRQSCAKQLYVSPFIAMDARYAFTIDPPADAVRVVINESDADGPLLYASFTGRRMALTDRALARCFFRYPLMTLKVIAGIHWEALRLWRKGVPLVARPAPPADLVTVVRSDPSTPEKGARAA